MSIPRKVLVTATNYSTLCAESRALFEGNGWQVTENTFGRPMAFDELKEQVADIDAVVAGVDTWNEAVFQLAPKLKIISRFGVGVDNIDLEAARRLGIKVTNAPGKNANAVAELTIGLLLATLRNIPSLHHDALASGKLRAAAIDVHEVEPVSADNPLFQLPNIVTTPHTAAETRETYRAVGLHTAQSILDEFEGTNPPPGL